MLSMGFGFRADLRAPIALAGPCVDIGHSTTTERNLRWWGSARFVERDRVAGKFSFSFT